MTDQKVFRLVNGQATSLKGMVEPLEKPIQVLIEKNLNALLGVQFLASEFTTGKQHSGRIDSLGIDENGCPVIIEFKARKDENVINQGLYYLNWLMDHQGDFRVLVDQRLSSGDLPSRFKGMAIDFKAARVVCIAGDFTKFDIHAVQQINRNIELIRFTRFGDEILFLELVNGEELSQPSPIHPHPTPLGDPEPGKDVDPPPGPQHGTRKAKTVSQYLAQAPEDLQALYASLRDHLLSMGDDVQEKTNLDYVAFRRLKNFACLEVHNQPKRILVFLKVDPTSVEIQPDFTRDVRAIGHFGTGDLEVSIRSLADLEKAKPLILQSYEAG